MSTGVEPGGQLTTSRLIAGTPDRLFKLWTDPAHVQRWWGPEGVDCPYAELDLKQGGAYRIANRMSDGTVVWISGEFEVVDPPSLLVYTWRTDANAPVPERVTVRFAAQGDMTELTVLHELVPDVETMRSHENGWCGCLDALAEYAAELG